MSMFKFKLCFVVLLVMVMAGCASKKPQLTPLEIQSIQTHEYDAAKDVVFPSVLSVFQDLGYIVKTADKDTGFITAESPIGDKTGGWGAFAGAALNQQTLATAFVEQIGQVTKVRLNLVIKREASLTYGQSVKDDEPILDPETYRSAFEKISTAIFIRSGS